MSVETHHTFSILREPRFSPAAMFSVALILAIAALLIALAAAGIGLVEW